MENRRLHQRSCRKFLHRCRAGIAEVFDLSGLEQNSNEHRNQPKWIQRSRQKSSFGVHQSRSGDLHQLQIWRQVSPAQLQGRGESFKNIIKQKVGWPHDWQWLGIPKVHTARRSVQWEDGNFERQSAVDWSRGKKIIRTKAKENSKNFF